MKSTLIAIVILLELCGGHRANAQTADVTGVLARLQDPTSTDDAVNEIESSDTDVKKSISARLPAMMLKEDNYVIRNNESKLAGDLKVGACVPILYRIYVKGDALPTGVTASMRWRLTDDPAGHALVQIGDPAVPYMKELLTSGDVHEREKAVRVLANINSPTALDALRAHRSSESDKYLQGVIDNLAPPN